MFRCSRFDQLKDSVFDDILRLAGVLAVAEASGLGGLVATRNILRVDLIFFRLRLDRPKNRHPLTRREVFSNPVLGELTENNAVEIHDTSRDRLPLEDVPAREQASFTESRPMKSDAGDGPFRF